MSEIRTVLFDYGLVLSGPPDPTAWEQMKHLLTQDEAAFQTAYWRFRHDYDRGALNAEAYWRSVAGGKLKESELAQLTSADTNLWTQPNQPMIAWAAQLQQAGMRTGILSNIGDAMEAGVRERCGWISGFAHLTFSHRLGIAKPELAIYRHATDGLGTSPEQILFIDDREDNTAAAREAGMQAVQYTNHSAFLNDMRKRGFGYLLDLS